MSGTVDDLQDNAMKQAEEFWREVAPEQQKHEIKLRAAGLHALKLAVLVQSSFDAKLSVSDRHKSRYGFFKTVNQHGRVAVAVPVVSDDAALQKHVYRGPSTSRTVTKEVKVYSAKALSQATDSWSDSCKLGEGGFGVVHKGLLVSEF